MIHDSDFDLLAETIQSKSSFIVLRKTCEYLRKGPPTVAFFPTLDFRTITFLAQTSGTHTDLFRHQPLTAHLDPIWEEGIGLGTQWRR